jgi:thioredoxin reductase (NADPH)
VEISGELSDVMLSAFDARRRMLTTMGEGGLVLAGDDDRVLHRLQEFAERNQLPYRTVLRADASGWSELTRTTALPEAGTVVVTGDRRVLTAPTTRDLATVLGIDLWGFPTTHAVTCSWWAPDRRGWRPPSTGRRRDWT